MQNQNRIIIREFNKDDREAVRRISCGAAFLEASRKQIFSDDEILADALTRYFTDYEPESCFVAFLDNKVIGYIIGTQDVLMMSRIMNVKVIPHLLHKALRKGIFFRWVNLKFLFYSLRSLLKGEFYTPDFSKEFPATLHINIDKAYRRQGIGEKLIETYLTYLKHKKVQGVHFGTFLEGAKFFFTKMGFNILFQSKRTYLKPYLGKEINFYVFGRGL